LERLGLEEIGEGETEGEGREEEAEVEVGPEAYRRLVVCSKFEEMEGRLS
jgi:hypothetical protein